MACILCPRASKLPGHPSERGGGAHPSSGAKIHCLPKETTAGPWTTCPLTPVTHNVMALTQGETDPLNSDTFEIYSQSGARTKLFLELQIYTRTCTHVHTWLHSLSQDAYEPLSPPPHPPLRRLLVKGIGSRKRCKKLQSVCCLLADGTNSAKDACTHTHTHRKICTVTQLELRLIDLNKWCL